VSIAFGIERNSGIDFHDSADLTTSWLSLVNIKLRRRTPLMGPNSGRGDGRFSSRATEVELTTDAGPSSPHQSCPGYIIATPGYDFREEQVQRDRRCSRIELGTLKAGIMTVG
jgi:hypothetical protein